MARDGDRIAHSAFQGPLMRGFVMPKPERRLPCRFSAAVDTERDGRALVDTAPAIFIEE